jgi:hypothetical protein
MTACVKVVIPSRLEGDRYDMVQRNQIGDNKAA